MPTPTPHGVVPLVLLALLAAGAPSAATRPATPPDHVRQAAQHFVDTLAPPARAEACRPFDDADRTDWHFVPRRRSGLPLAAMSDAERRATHGLLRSALSPAGYLKVTGIMELEVVLHEIEDAAHRDPERYHFTIFGHPADADPWGWRIEGHHVSLNFTSVGDAVVATTPAFLGANPAEVRDGRRSGWRVLAGEERLARELLATLDDEQRVAAIITDRAPRDILLGPGRDVDDLGDAVGLPAARLTPPQHALLMRLVAEYLDNLAPGLATRQRDRLTQAGTDAIRFAWAGATEPGRPHYYRLHGPTFVIEYDNVQNGANHVHTVWRDPARDFGDDVLRAHHERHHASPETPP